MTTAFEEVMSARARPAPASDEVRITGSDPVLPTRYRIGGTAASVLAGVGVAVNDLWELRTGRRQQVTIDVRHATAALKSSTLLQRPDGAGHFRDVVNPGHETMLRMTQPWPTQDGRFVLPHFGLPNLRARMLALLGCEDSPEAVARAVSRWNALDLEDAIDAHRVCGGMVRSQAEWLATPHGQILAGKPIVEIIRIGDSPPEPIRLPPDLAAGSSALRPLSGLRVLDLTRILAGPICARTLAEHGAEVLMVTAERLPQIAEHVMDTSHGKRSCFLDLNQPGDSETLRGLVRDADVFSQGYRPGMINQLGFGPEALAALRPGLIYTSINCYGTDGPFSHRGGWEQVAQTVTGICHGNDPARPHLLPAAACDYTTGYLAAYGVLLALHRRAQEGGSYHVRVSLCQSAMFIQRQGCVNGAVTDLGLSPEEVDALRIESTPAHLGPIRHLAPILRLSETSPHWVRPTPKLGADRPQWLQGIPR